MKPAIAPGKRTLTMNLPQPQGGAPPPVQRKSSSGDEEVNRQRAERTEQWMKTAIRPDLNPLPAQDGPAPGSLGVQMRGGQARSGGDVHQLAAQGVTGAPSSLPHHAQIQRSFGHHDVSDIAAHVGGAAAAASEAIGAEAYATGNHVAFRASPDLHTAAHEAAHVVQQRAGVQLSGGVGKAGDAYEKHADLVADRVTRGQSAEELLDGMAGSPASASVQRTPAVQRSADREAVDRHLRRAQRRLTAVGGIFDRRKDAVSVLVTDLDADATSSLGMELLKAAAKTSLAVATGGIGGVIGSAIGQMVADGAAKMVSEYVKSTISSQLDTLVEQAYTRFPGGVDGPSRGPFLQSQLQALNDAVQAAGDALDARRSDFYAADDGAEQAQALADAYDQQTQAAYDRQYLAATAEWSRLVDASQRLTHRDHGRMDTTAEGILGIDIDLANDDPGADIRVSGAHLDGIPEGVRQRLRTLRGLTLQELCTQDSGMTIRVIQEVQGGGLLDSADDRRTRLALESRPGARNALMPVVTGTQGMYMLERGRRRYGMELREQDYDMVPIVAAVMWARDINPIRLMDLPEIEG